MEVDRVKESTNVYTKMRVGKYAQIPEWLTCFAAQGMDIKPMDTIQNRKSD
jgi:hypothetical protein